MRSPVRASILPDRGGTTFPGDPVEGSYSIMANLYGHEVGNGGYRQGDPTVLFDSSLLGASTSIISNADTPVWLRHLSQPVLPECARSKLMHRSKGEHTACADDGSPCIFVTLDRTPAVAPCLEGVAAGGTIRWPAA